VRRRPVGVVAAKAVVVVAFAIGPGGAGCALPQGEACRAYVTCQNAVDASVDTAAWDEGGDCWTLPDTARRCEAQCRAALEALLDTPAPPQACLDGAEATLADAAP
jgi:hypothetical protein